MVKPRHFLPIHGELRHLKRHAALAIEVGIPEENVLVVENGQVVELSGSKIRLGERIPGGYVFVDGQSIGDVDYDIMRERGKLARNGIFLIDISVDELDGHLLHDPEIITRGFVSPEDAEELIPEVRRLIMDMVNEGGLDSEKDIVNAVRSYLYEETKRRPMVLVTLSKGQRVLQS
jgi:ribonuclease J